MKILVCSNYRDAWNSVRPEAEVFIQIARMGHQVTIATHPDSPYIERFREQGLKVLEVYPKRKICLQTIRSYRNELKQGNYDIIYSMNSKTIPNAAFAAIGLPVKVVNYRGTVGGVYRHDPSAYLTHLHPRVNGIICVAEAVRESLLQHVWTGRERIATIHKGHELSWYEVAATPRASLQLQEDDCVVICVANARPSKGVSVLIEASHQLADIQGLKILLVGRDIDKPPYIEQISASPMAQRIQVLGHRSDVPGLMKSSDMLVQPSVSGEGLPKTVMEAMAQGLPCIATTTGGAKEVLENGESGVIIPTKDAAAIAGAIRDLAAHPDKRSRLGAHAKQALAGPYSLQKTAQKHLEYFSRLVGN